MTDGRPESAVPTIEVSLTRQQLVLHDGAPVPQVFAVSTSRYGPGEQAGSLCTPRGLHVIRAKIGAGLPTGAVIRGRRFTGEVLTPDIAGRFPDRDWILTRILWLSGLEQGRNRLGAVDSMRRYIYIHGTPEAEPMEVPFSHGCIRMRNADVVLLFDRVTVGTRVEIVP